MLFQDLPIRRKLIGLISLVSLSVLAVAAVVMLGYEFGNSRRDMAGKQITIGRIIAANCSAALVRNEAGAAHEALFALKAEPAIRGAALYDKQGKLFARY